MKEITEKLLELQDLKYKDFQCKLMPTVDPDTVIGIRTPQLRLLSKELAKNENIGEFLSELPHRYYEENNLHGFIIEKIKDYDDCIAALDRFLPFVDNWATCDMMKPKCFKNNTDKLITEIERWLSSDKTYTVRFGIGMLMTHYLDSEFKPCYLERVAKIKSDEYYINMMLSWYFATALAKQYESTLPLITENRLPIWVHNKTIQKAVESYRLDENQKTFLKSLKHK